MVLSAELGAILTFAIIIFSNRKQIVLSSTIEKKAIGRISELNQSFQKLSMEMQNLNQEVEKEIDDNKNQLSLLESKITDLSSTESKLQKQIDLLQKTNPAVLEIFTNIQRKEGNRTIVCSFLFYLLGVFTPTILNLLGNFFHII
jgi:predicted ribosome quality control (RQC) complex YloA/Tae2 family protein